MSHLLLFPIKVLGWTAVGLALGVGWKLGCHLVDVVMGEKDLMVCPAKKEGPQEGQAPTGPASQPEDQSAQ
jgi:hypothetical protein